MGFWYDPRGSLDAVITQVPSIRSCKMPFPIVDEHCLPGTIFCSDGWKAYHKLREHSQLEDVHHFPVNHSENFVHPESGPIRKPLRACGGILTVFYPALD